MSKKIITTLFIALLLNITFTHPIAADNYTVVIIQELPQEIETVIEIIVEPEYVPPVTCEVWWSVEDVALLAAVISAEARGENYEGQLAVGCVVLNRLNNGFWGESIQEVIYAPNQFARPYWDYGDSEYQAALACLEGERILPENVLFFRTKRVDIWYGAEWYMTLGYHNFYAVN